MDPLKVVLLFFSPLLGTDVPEWKLWRMFI